MERLDDGAIGAALGSLEWERHGDELVKVVHRRDFADSLAFVNAVGALAEAQNHHPDIELTWDTVTLHLSTHSKGGITDADLTLAREIDGLT